MFRLFVILFSLFTVLLGATSVDERLTEHIAYSQEGPNRVGYLAIKHKEAIDQSTWLYVRSALEHYKKQKPIFLILDLDTPGGELLSAEEISDALVEMDAVFGIPVVCFIDRWALSAGAMLAYSCRFIAVTRDASMGAAEPVVASSSGEMTSASEKVNSAVRADFANRARFYGRNPFVAEAMVDKDIILVMRQGEIIKVDSEAQIITTGPHPDRVISPKGKLLTLDSQELMDLGVADFLIVPLPVGESAQESPVFQYPFFQKIPGITLDTYEMDWKSTFLAWLSTPIISSILFLGLMIGLYVEMNTGGFGVAAMISLICLFLILLSSFSVQAAGWLDVIMLGLGLLLILVELFVLPGFGFPGVLGIILTIVGLFSVMLPHVSNVDFHLDPDEMTLTGQAFMEKLGWLSGTLIVGVIIVILLARYVTPAASRYSRFVLRGEQERAQGYVAGWDVAGLPAVGTRGKALTPLRPSGKVLIAGTVYDSTSQGNFIEKDADILVITYNGNIMVVDRVVNEEKG